MRVKETKVYQYSELSDDAKERARDWYRECTAGDTFYAEHITDTLAPDAAKFLGIEISKPKHRRHGLAIYWSGFSSQGDGASFEGTWRAADVDAAGVKEEFPNDKELHRIADALAAIAGDYPDSTCDISVSGRYSHSGSMRFEYGTDEMDLAQLLRDFADWIYSALEKEYEYVNSDEQVAENIEANEYEFTADGERA